MTSPTQRIVLIVGTRPEAIKMAPVVRALRDRGMAPLLVSTGQHLDLLRTALAALELEPDRELAIMTPDQTPSSVAARVLERLPPLLAELQPSALLVQGDTTSVVAAALAAYYAGVPVGHVEAGLRTYDDRNPFPEEANRQVVARLARWHFAPTASARENLVSERVEPGRIYVTGNTAVDSLLWIVQRAPAAPARNAGALLLTLHRRESFGEPLRSILLAVRDLLDAVPEAAVRWPVHPNPGVKRVASEMLGEHPRVSLLEPLSYDLFAGELASARVILSDSGGVQEEAPSLGTRVLVARDTTERPEAVDAGHNRLVGRERGRIREALLEAWHEPPYAGPRPAPNPYGDGTAGERIAAILAAELDADER